MKSARGEPEVRIPDVSQNYRLPKSLGGLRVRRVTRNSAFPESLVNPVSRSHPRTPGESPGTPDSRSYLDLRAPRITRNSSRSHPEIRVFGVTQKSISRSHPSSRSHLSSRSHPKLRVPESQPEDSECHRNSGFPKHTEVRFPGINRKFSWSNPELRVSGIIRNADSRSQPELFTESLRTSGSRSHLELKVLGVNQRTPVPAVTINCGFPKSPGIQESWSHVEDFGYTESP